MPSRRDFLKTTGGLVLATGGTWLATHAHGAVPNPPGLAPLPSGAVAVGRPRGAAGQGAADQEDLAPAEFRNAALVFRRGFTPNKAFFVRYHLAGIPRGRGGRLDAQDRRRRGRNAVRAQRSTQLKRDFPAVEVTAVNQCSGNRRGLFDPHVAGRRVGRRRDGQRALERRAAQGRAREGRPQEGSARDRLRRRRRSGDARHAGFRRSRSRCGRRSTRTR